MTDRPDSTKAEIESQKSSEHPGQCSSSILWWVDKTGDTSAYKKSDGSYDFGPWLQEKVFQDGNFLGERTTNETSGEKNPGHDTSFRVRLPNNDYQFPDGKENAVLKDPFGTVIRNVVPGTEEYKEVHAALDALHFDTMPFCSSQEHTVKNGETLPSIIKADVLGADSKKDVPGNHVNEKTLANLVEHVAELNHLKKAEDIEVGQKLVLPTLIELEPANRT